MKASIWVNLCPHNFCNYVCSIFFNSIVRKLKIIRNCVLRMYYPYNSLWYFHQHFWKDLLPFRRQGIRSRTQRPHCSRLRFALYQLGSEARICRLRFLEYLAGRNGRDPRGIRAGAMEFSPLEVGTLYYLSNDQWLTSHKEVWYYHQLGHYVRHGRLRAIRRLSAFWTRG